jgi:hypothetical protein
MFSDAGGALYPSGNFNKYLKDVKFVTSVTEIQANMSGELKEPFQTMTVDGKLSIALPSNIQEIAKANYLVSLYMKVLDRLDYTPVELEKVYISKFKMDQRQNTFVQSFGILLLTGKLPELPSNKGTVWKGIASSVLCFLQGQKGIDPNLFKVRSAPRPALEIFGDVWGKNYPTEKHMLDCVVHAIRDLKLDLSNLGSYLLDAKLITTEKGLNLDLPSDIASQSELELLGVAVEAAGGAVYKLDLTKQVIDSMDKIESLQRHITRRQAAIRDLKDAIKVITTDRIKAAFAPYKGKQRDKVKQTPIKELITKIEGTDDFKPFNPTLFSRCLRVTSLPKIDLTLAGPSQSQQDLVEEFCKELSNKGVNNTLVRSLAQEYWRYAESFVSH